MNAASQFAEASRYYEDGDLPSSGMRSPLVQDAEGHNIAECEVEMTVSGVISKYQHSRWFQAGVVVSHLLTGVFFYVFVFNLDSLDEKAEVNQVVDSVYFAVIVFTTVGYGDFVPDSPSGKVFTVAFAYVGVWLIASRWPISTPF